MAHYLVFHQILPEALFDYLMDDFVRACSINQQGSILYEYAWQKCYKNLEPSLLKRAVMRTSVRPESFPVLADEKFGAYRLLVVGTPPPESTPQARYIGLWFKSSDTTKLLRYFASELPVDPSLSGDVLGEWNREKSHRNFGAYCNPSAATPQAFIDSICQVVGQSRELPDRSRGSDTISAARADVRKKLAKRTQNDNSVDDSSHDLPKAHPSTTRQQRAASEKPGRAGGVTSWTDEPNRIAESICDQLRGLARANKSVLIVSSELAEGLRVEVSTYLQFKIMSSKKLLTEIQGDYSYWGVSVPSGDWHRFQSLGFTAPSSANGNFSTVFDQFGDEEALREWLSDVVNLMQKVLQPTGELGIRFF